jgi:hypothetical protein
MPDQHTVRSSGKRTLQATPLTVSVEYAKVSTLNALASAEDK